jgi:hypothetical protein
MQLYMETSSLEVWDSPIYIRKSVLYKLSLVSHIRADTTLGRSFYTNLEWTQMVSGISTPLLESSENITYIKDNWIMNVREFLRTTKATIELTNPWSPSISRENDIMIMDRAITADYLKNTSKSSTIGDCTSKCIAYRI